MTQVKPTAQPNTKNVGSAKARKSAARLLAVQAVYQMQSDVKQKPDAVIKEYLEHRAGMEIDGDSMVPAEPDHFTTVVRGVTEHQEQLQTMIKANRGKDDKIEPLLNAIFLCGAFELMAMQSIDAPIIIADYMHVAHAFYEAGEEKLVNAVLDSMAKTVRD